MTGTRCCGMRSLQKLSCRFNFEPVVDEEQTGSRVGWNGGRNSSDDPL